MEKKLRATLRDGAFQTSADRSAVMSKIRSKGNRATEWRLRMILVRAGVRGWTLHPHGIQGKPDFFFSDRRVAIFVDGCFWHACPICGHAPKAHSAFWKLKLEGNKIRDLRTTKALSEKGISVLRFWEHELKINASGVSDRIIRSLFDDASPISKGASEPTVRFRP